MLGNFSYCNPTKLYCGEDSLNYLNTELPRYGKNVVLIYGGGSIKKNGIYDDVMSILKENEKNVAEIQGVMPNPTVDKPVSYTHLDVYKRQIDIPSLLEEYGQNATIIQIVGNVPIIGPIMVILHTVLLFTFIATTLDSTAFNLASMTSKKLAGDEEPALPMKFMWVIIILTVTAILQAIGGLSAVQVTTVVASLPMIIVLGIMIVSTKRMLKTVK